MGYSNLFLENLEKEDYMSKNRKLISIEEWFEEREMPDLVPPMESH